MRTCKREGSEGRKRLGGQEIEMDRQNEVGDRDVHYRVEAPSRLSAADRPRHQEGALEKQTRRRGEGPVCELPGCPSKDAAEEVRFRCSDMEKHCALRSAGPSVKGTSEDFEGRRSEE